MIDENVAPIPKAGVDFSSLSPSPTPEQYFLLSRLDGELTVGELCKISGMGRQKTLDALESLAQSGAIELPGFDTSPPPDDKPDRSAAAASSAADGAQAASSVAEQTSSGDSKGKSKRSKKRVTPNYPTPVDKFDFDQRLLSLDVPLDEEHRRELMCLHGQLDQMSFYDIFGVTKDASKKDIKKAYFRMSKRYHPDKFFRKEMDDFGEMLETVFKEITKAYRTLSNKRKREEYDAELEAQSPEAGHASPSTAAKPSSHAERVGAGDSAPVEDNKRKAAAVLLMRRAEKLQSQGRYAPAAGEYRKALALKRDPALAMRVARMLLEDADLPEEASSFARAALKLGADEASARFLLGRAHEALGVASSAIEEYRRVLSASPEHAEARARLDALGAQS